MMHKLTRFLNPRHYQQVFNRLVEEALLRYPATNPKAQIFILGLPRSGTTLIYQYIVHRMNVAYFMDGDGATRYYPCLHALWNHKRYGQYDSDFQSDYGSSQGRVAPHEAGGVWGRFMDNHQYSTLADTNPRKLEAMQRTVYALQKLWGDVPFVNKNVKHMLRLPVLAHVFHDAYFLIVDRDMSDVALSILRGRYKNLDNPLEWWSVKPPNYEALKDLALIEQIIGQVVALQEQLDADLSAIPSERVLRVSYGEFCSNPEALIQQLQRLPGDIYLHNQAMDSFALSKNQVKNEEEAELLKRLEEYGIHTT